MTAKWPFGFYPLVGIVTPIRNRKDYSLQFLSSLEQQDYPFLKLYMVDANSTDGSREALEERCASALTILTAPDSAYWSAATNIGVSRALAEGCDYILTVNDDAIIPDDFVSTMVRAAMGGSALVVGCVIAMASAPDQLWGVGAYCDWRSGCFLQLRMSGASIDDVARLRARAGPLLSVDYLCGNGTLVHRTVYEQVGLYEARYTPHYHADSEFTMRVERAGIERWVALDARLYNRFDAGSEGHFASRNQRLFSLRSASYMPALLYIIDRHCPRDLAAQALVRYCVRYLHRQHWRTWSKILRALQFLETAAEERSARLEAFLPPLDEALCAAEDIRILMRLTDKSFVVMAYAILLRREASDFEYQDFLAKLQGGVPRADIIAIFVDSDEFKVTFTARHPFLATIAGRGTGRPPVGELTQDERWLASQIRDTGAVPSRRAVSGRRGAHLAIAGDAAASSRLAVFMNVDVLCQAVTDPRAATGVHRYVSNLLPRLAGDDRVDLSLFHSPRWQAAAAALKESGAWPAHIRAAPLATKPATGLVFYPYFASDRKDKRFAHLPHALTICDLFPLTHPEWFSDEAIANFRLQLHSLADMDHIFCISKASQEELHKSFPGLAATSSVAHLGRPDEGAGSASRVMLRRLRRRIFREPYLLCVGTIEPRKNLGAVMSAMAHLHARGMKHLQMYVVGQEGWLTSVEALKALAQGSADHIHFLGRISDHKLRDLYEGALCTVFPSLEEGFGFPIVESFSCATPVITSNRSSMREIAAKGAVLVDPLEAEQIAAAIALLSTDRALRDRLAVEAREQASLFSWQRCAHAHIQGFEAIMQRRAAAG